LGRSHLVKSSVYSDNVELSYANQFWMHDLKCYMEHPQVCLSMVEDVHNCRIDAKSDIAAAFNTSNQPKQIAEGIAISFAEKIKDDADAGRFAECDVFISFMKSLSESFEGRSFCDGDAKFFTLFQKLFLIRKKWSSLKHHYSFPDWQSNRHLYLSYPCLPSLL